MMRQNKKQKGLACRSTTEGFTLIETLVAITILLLAITGPLQIAAQALFSAFYARDEITAFYLASEAIEYVKNSRDTTFLEDVFGGATTPNQDWLNGLRACVSEDQSTKGCTIDATKAFMAGNAIASCPVAGCPPINFDSSTGIWNYDSAHAPSKFTRTVEIIPQLVNGIADEAIIEVKVSWQSTALYQGERKVILTGLISNWQRK